MSWSKAVRRLSAAAAAVALTSATATPSYAQADPITIQVLLPDMVVAVDGSKLDAYDAVVSTNRPADLTNLTLTFELSALAGVATVDSTSSCSTSGTQLICDHPFETFVDETGLGIASLDITAAPGAVAGDTATLTVTADADGIEPATDGATVTIGAPVDLVASDDISIAAAPGDTLALPWTVHNAGPEPADGVALQVFSDLVLRPHARHGNCRYDERDNALCTFDVVLEPGTTYEFGSPLAIDVGADAAAPGFFAIEGRWMTLAEGAAEADRLDSSGVAGEPGTGPALSLVEVGGGTPEPVPASPVPAAETNPDDNWTMVSVPTEGDNQPDFAAVGAELTGDVGELVTAEVGVQNLGPATADHGRSGEPVNHFQVTVPPGTTAVEVPGTCSPLAEDELPTGDYGAAGAAAYLCHTGTQLLVGASDLVPFVLRIDEAVPDATGFVRVNQSAGAPTKPEDYNPGNDEAEIVVNPASGSGGGLPVTGAATWTIAVSGVLLVALGAAGMLLVRRRRARFVA